MGKTGGNGGIVRTLTAMAVIVGFLALLVPPAEAFVPDILSFQGRLTDPAGNLLGGNSGTDYYFRFRIYEAETGGAPTWTSSAGDGTPATVTQGVFNILLGDTTLDDMAALTADFTEEDNWLAVDVCGTDSTCSSFETMFPRQRIVASGYALVSQNVFGGDVEDIDEFTQDSLTNCNAATSKVIYDITLGEFSCATDLQGSGGASIGLREGFTGGFINFSSISFNAPHFTLDFSNADARVSLDWGAGGPASLSQNETVTGTWTFTNSPIGNFRPASNSLDWDEFVNAMTVDVATTINAAAGLTFSNASVSGALEIGSLLGAGLTDCDGTLSKLLWNVSTGLFSCGVDQTGSSFSGLEVREGAGAFTRVGSMSFNAPHFVITFPTASESFVSLDWGAGGPASLSQNETVTGTWTFANPPIGNFRPASNSLDWDEFVNAMTVDAPTTINAAAGLTFTNASVSGTFEAALVKATTIDSDTNHVNITANASVSGNFEVSGTASAAATFGSGLTDCDGAAQKLLWNVSTGLFSCGTDLQGSGGSSLGMREGFTGGFTNKSSISFNAPHFNLDLANADARLSLDWGPGGPASLSQDETVTGHWNFTNGASFSGPVEFSNGASFSSITLGGQTFTTLRPASNSLDWDEFVNAMTLDANTTTNLNGNTLTFGGLLLAGTNASISGNLEVAGYSSSSAIFGAGLTDCDADGQTVSWDATTGRFGCGDDDTGSSFAGIGLREDSSATFLHITSISFAAPHFNITNTASQAFVRLDWGPGGPASLSQDETVTGHWNFTNGASFSGPVEFSNGASFSNIFIGGNNIGTGRLVSSNSLDYDEFVNAMTVDVTTTVNAAAGLIFTNASVSGTFEAALVKATTIDSDTNHVNITANASVSGNFEVSGTASAAATFGSGLTDCDGAAQKLLWNVSTGLFSCGADLQGSGGSAVGLREGFTGPFTNFSSISFNAPHFVLDMANPDARLSLDWGPGGPASLSQDETVTGTWTFTNPPIGNFRPASNSLDWDEFVNAMTLDANTTTNLNGNTLAFGGLSLAGTNASISGNLEVAGYSSSSFLFGAGLSVCTSAQKLQYNANGTFTCVTDQTGSSFSGLEVREGAGAFTRVGSMSFNAPHFVITFPTASESFVSLDWGPGGPASLSQDETVTGTWTFTNSPIGNFRPASNSLDYDEFVNAMTVDVTTTVNAAAGLIFTNASVSGTFETAILKATTIDSDTNHVNITANASVSGNLEIAGFVSASSTFGSGLTDCDSATSKLLWNVSTGLFSCGTDSTSAGGASIGMREGFTGTFMNFSSISFNAPHFVLDTANPDARLSLDWGAGGPASLSQDETVTGHWNFTNGASFSGPVEFSNGASISGLTVPLSSITAAIAANTISNGDFAQVWNWSLTTASKSAFIFGETLAATGVGNRLLRVNTLATSTATPLFINNLGSASSLLIHDSASDSSPFVVSAAGHVGIGSVPTVGQALLINKTFGNESSGGTQSAFTINASSSITAGFSQINGIIGTVRNSATTGTTGVTRGAFLTIQANGSQAYTTGNFVNLLLSNQTLPSQVGTIVDSTGIRLNTPSFTGAVPTSVFGINLLNQGFAGVASSSALRILAQSGSTNNYAIISALGNLHGFGTETPSRTVDIVGTFRVTGTGSVSSNFEIGGFVSASATFGSGLTDCDLQSQTLNWDATTGRFSCLTDGGGVASNSLDYDEFVNAMTVDVATTVNAAAGLTFTNASVSGTFEAALVKATTIDSDTNQVNITANASVSGNFEVSGTASAAATFGSGLTDCDADGQTVAWNITTGFFSCGDDDSGSAGQTLDITLLPEYPGAVMSSTSGSCTTCIGSMTSDNDLVSPFRNFYKWTTTQVASQTYDIWAKVDLPNDFSTFSSVSIEGFRSSTTDRVYFAIFDTANAQSGSTPGNGVSVATTNGVWTTATVTAPTGTYTAGRSVTFRIRMMAGTNQNVRAGRIRIEYVASF